MEYILNKTYVKTTNGFKINDIKVNLDLLTAQCNEIKINGLENKYIKSIIKSRFNSNIGLSSTEYKSTTIDITNEKKVNIYYEFNDEFLISNELNINLESNSNSEIIIIFTGNKGINNFKLKINASSECISNISIINFSNKSLIAIENEQLDNSKVTCNFIDLGGNLGISNYYSKLIGDKSINYLNTIYMGLNDDRIDCNYYIKCLGKNTNAYINSYGVLDNNSYKTYKGTIDFVSGSINSVGKEIEKCILLSDTAKSKSLPMLLCSEENVIGNHGVSTGKIDENQLFYLMSKGISEKEAKKLIIMGNFNQIINNISDSEISKKIIDNISNNLI